METYRANSIGITPTDAGTYRASIVLNENGKKDSNVQANPQNAIDGTKAFVVQKCALNITLLQSSINDILDITYNGSALAPSAEDIKNIANLSESLYGNKNLYAVNSIQDAIDAGIYHAIELKLIDPDNYAWSNTNTVVKDKDNETNMDIVNNMFTTLSFTINPIKESEDYKLTFTKYDENSAVWAYDGTTHIELFSAKIESVIADLSSNYIYYVQVGNNIPTWTNSKDAESNGWTAFTATDFASFGSNMATNSNKENEKHWIVVVLPESANYTEVSTEIKSYVVNKRTINITVNDGDDFIAGEYREGLTADMLVKPNYIRDIGTLPSGISGDNIITANMRIVFSYYGKAWSGKDFGENGTVEAGKYDIHIELPESAEENFVLGTVVKGKYIVQRTALYSDDIEVNSLVYDGETHEPIDFIDVNCLSDLWTAVGTARKNVGTYTFRATLTEEASYNYYWYENTGDAVNNNIKMYRTLVFSIQSADIEFSEGILSYENKTNNEIINNVAFGNKDNTVSWSYNDNIDNVKVDATLQTKGGVIVSDVNVILYYASAKDRRPNWTTELPTEAGTYYVIMYVQGEGNHTEAYSATVKSGSTSYMLEGYYVTISITVAENSLTNVNATSTVVYGSKGIFSAVPLFGELEIGFAMVDDFGETIPSELHYAKLTEDNFPKNAGKYFVRFHVASANNYDGIDEYREFEVTKANLIATIEDVIVTYGSNVSAPTRFTVSGYKYSDSALTNEVNAALKVVGYSAGNDVNDYQDAIQLDGVAIISGLPNYTVTFRNGTLHVVKKHIEVNVLSQEQTYVAGGDAPNFFRALGTGWEVVTPNGLYGNDKIVIDLTLENTISGKYNVGSYVINGSVGTGEKTDNYDISITAGVLSVVAKEINISKIIANDCIYGDVKAVTFNVSGITGAKGDMYEVAENVVIRVTYYADNQEASTIIPVNAGTYNVTLKLEGDDSANYALTGSFSATLYIAKKQLSLATAQEEAYNLKTTEEYEYAPDMKEIRDRYFFKLFYTGNLQTVNESEFNALVDIMQTRNGFLAENDQKYVPFTAKFELGRNVGSYNIYLTLTEEIANNYVWDTTGSDRADMVFEIVQETANYVQFIKNDGQTEASWAFDGYEAFTGTDITAVPHRGFYSYTAKFGGEAVQYQFYIVGADCEDYPIDYTPVNVGEYKLQVVIPETENYSGCVSNKLPIHITVRKLTVNFSDANYMGGQYGNTIHPASATVSLYDTKLTKHNINLNYVTLEYVYYGTSNDGIWSYDVSNGQIETPTRAGAYTVRVTLGDSKSNEYNNNFVLVDNDGNPLDNGSETAFVISKAYVYKDLIIINTIDWDGNDHYPRAIIEENNDNYGIKYYVTDEDNIGRSEVGTHTFFVTLVDSNNYRWASVADSDKVQLSFNIKRTGSLEREVEVSKLFGKDANLPNLGFVYSQVPNVNPNVIYYIRGSQREFEYMEDYVIIYAKDGTLTPTEYLSWKNGDSTPNGWTMTLPESVGKYVALAWIDNDNFQGYSAQIHFEISPLSVVVVMTTEENGVYGEKAPSFTAMAYDSKDINSETGKLNAGALPILMKPNLNVTNDAIYASHTIYYRGTGNTMYPRSTVMPTEAGTYIRELVLSSNYDNALGKEITCEFRIEPKKISVSEIQLSNGTVYYDGTSHILDKAFIETYGGGIVEVVSGLPVSSGVVNAGEYAVELRLKDTRNYAWADSTNEYATAYFKVEKATVKLEAPSIEGWTYGEIHSEPTVSGVFNNGKPFVGTVVYEYAVRGSDNWSTEVPVNAGEYIIRARLNGGNNCDNFTSEPTNFTITRAKLEKPTAGDNVTNNDDSWTFIPEGYNESVQNINGNVANSEGTYHATVSIKDKNNYQWTDGTQSDVVLDWTAKPTKTSFYITVAALSGTAVLLILSLIPIGIAAKRRKDEKKSMRNA